MGLLYPFKEYSANTSICATTGYANSSSIFSALSINATIGCVFAFTCSQISLSIEILLWG